MTPAAVIEAPRTDEALVPEQTRCEMPEQRLWPEQPGRLRTHHRVQLARLLLVSLWLAATAAFGWTLYRVLSVESPTALQLVFWLLSTLCFAWVAIGSASALVGFLWLMLARTGDTLELPRARRPRMRTALLFPVYKEEPGAVAATIDVMCRDLHAAQAGDRFDVFILSDTQEAADRHAERRVYARLRSAVDMPVYVRWRTPNTAKKAGNIRDWIERFGGAYPWFVILDADSIMSAETLIRLVAAMEDHKRAGLIQTVPRVVGGATLFARLQQFAAGYYGRIVAAGLAAWHGPGGNYWGHNAIIRTQAFADSAGLPPLPGAPPLGGHILSHDFVEAALLRRAGWEVHMVPSLGGTFEGCPPTLTDLVIRDRRWAQGNLQHLRLLGVRGLPFLSRLHLGMGAVSYLASPVWALTLLVGVVLAVQAKYATPAYFGSEVSLFPKWPVFDAKKALALFFATVVVVHLPKLLGAIWASRNAAERNLNGGAARVAGGVLLESVLSTLIAPVLMLTQTSAVLSIFFGGDAGWAAQRRAGAGASLWQFMHQHRWHALWGLAAAAVCWAISPAVFAWMSPIILGLVFAAPLARITAKRAASGAARLLTTADERRLHPLLAKLADRRRYWEDPTLDCPASGHEVEPKIA